MAATDTSTALLVTTTTRRLPSTRTLLAPPDTPSLKTHRLLEAGEKSQRNLRKSQDGCLTGGRATILTTTGPLKNIQNLVNL